MMAYFYGEVGVVMPSQYLTFKGQFFDVFELP